MRKSSQRMILSTRPRHVTIIDGRVRRGDGTTHAEIFAAVGSARRDHLCGRFCLRKSHASSGERDRRGRGGWGAMPYLQRAPRGVRDDRRWVRAHHLLRYLRATSSLRGRRRRWAMRVHAGDLFDHGRGVRRGARRVRRCSLLRHLSRRPNVRRRWAEQVRHEPVSKSLLQRYRRAMRPSVRRVQSGARLRGLRAS
jgi:hypothetical protein